MFEMIMNTRRLMELAFVRYEESCRSDKVSSAEADNTLLDLPYLSVLPYQTRPQQITAHYALISNFQITFIPS